jgi:hypothetical protein
MHGTVPEMNFMRAKSFMFLLDSEQLATEWTGQNLGRL